jgi:hypothetical protein
MEKLLFRLFDDIADDKLIECLSDRHRVVGVQNVEDGRL